MPMPPVCRDKWPQNRVSRGSKMLQLREFDLQFAFAGARALREDVENQRGAIEHLALENLFQVAALRGREFIVEDDRIDVVLFAILREFCRFACADERGGERAIQFLRAVADDSAPAVVASSANSSRDSLNFPAASRLSIRRR